MMQWRVQKRMLVLCLFLHVVKGIAVAATAVRFRSTAITIGIRLLHFQPSVHLCVAHVAAWNPYLQQQQQQQLHHLYPASSHSPWQVVNYSIPISASHSLLRLGSAAAWSDSEWNSNRMDSEQFHGRWLVQVRCQTNIGTRKQHQLSVEPRHGIVVSAADFYSYSHSHSIHSFTITRNEDENDHHHACIDQNHARINCPPHPPWMFEWKHWLSELKGHLMEDLHRWPVVQFLHRATHGYGMDLARLVPFSKIRAAFHPQALNNTRSTIRALLVDVCCYFRMLVPIDVVFSRSTMWIFFFITTVNIFIATILISQQMHGIDQADVCETESAASPFQFEPQQYSTNKDVVERRLVSRPSTHHDQNESLIQDIDRTCFDDLRSVSKPFVISIPEQESQEYDDIAPNI